MGPSKKRDKSKERKKKKHRDHSDDEQRSSKRKDKERLESDFYDCIFDFELQMALGHLLWLYSVDLL